MTPTRPEAPVILPGGGSAHFNALFNKKLMQGDIFPPVHNSPATTRNLDETQLSPRTTHLERQLGETEVSYFLPSRESGVNDMYLHLGLHAPAKHLARTRVSIVWAILQVRHPLLASKIKMNSYQDIRFMYNTPLSPNAAVAIADQYLEYGSQSKDDLIDGYLNGPRTLSNDRLSYLIISTTESDDQPEKNFNILIAATHFLGDGMALHQCANDFFGLLASPTDEAALMKVLTAEWSQRYSTEATMAFILPDALESRLPPSPSRLHRAAAQVDYDSDQRKNIGGHVFPRQSRGDRHTIVPTVSFTKERTKAILKNCKARGVSISSALFAICNIAWGRTHSTGWQLPTLMYSALNMRPNLSAQKRLNDSYWFIAIGYFNIILPSFLPRSSDLKETFWHRARSAKVQSSKAAKSSMIISRCQLTAEERGARARVWAKEDDDKAAGIPQAPKPATPPPQVSLKPKVPSSALMGLSLLGNLDGIYKHATFPDIKLHTLTTGSRQRSGGMLLFGYTFVEKLWVSFGYDENGIEEETVKVFWKNVLAAVDEFL